METPRKPLNKYWCSVPHYLSDIRNIYRYIIKEWTILNLNSTPKKTPDSTPCFTTCPTNSNGTKPCIYFIGNYSYTLYFMSQEQLILLSTSSYKPSEAKNILIQIPHPFTALFFVYFTKYGMHKFTQLQISDNLKF